MPYTVTTNQPAPSNLSASPNTYSVDLTWSDPSNNENTFRVYYRTPNGSWTKFSDPAPNSTSETITGLSQNQEYEFKVRVVTDHVSSDSNVTSEQTYLSESRSVSTHTNPASATANRVVSLLESVTSSMTASTSATRQVGLSRAETSWSTPISGGVSRDLSYTRNPESWSGSMDVSNSTVISLSINTESHSDSLSTSAGRIATLIAAVNSSSNPMTATSSRSQLDMTREGEASYAKAIRSFTYNERTSLELIDHNLTWEESEVVWYTNWFQESKILGTEDSFVIRSLVVPDSKEPAAIVVLQYDADGDGTVDETSDPVYLGSDQDVEDVTGIPIDESGYYRLKIMEYSGYNSLYAIDTGIVN